jgi:transposase
MDNLGSHKSDAVRAAISGTGARLFFLPPPDRVRGRLYSPDLNPIEQAFSKLKHALRKAKERTVEALWKRIGTLIQTFSKEECKNYFINAGWTDLKS